jgi:hypothetical protein
VLVTVHFVGDSIHAIAFSLDRLQFITTVFTDFHFGTIKIVMACMAVLTFA